MGLMEGVWCGPDGRMCGVGLMEGVWCGPDGRSVVWA